MQWNSAAEFFAMGGYALYVWGSFGLCALAMALEPLLLAQRHRAAQQALREQRRVAQLDAAEPGGATSPLAAAATHDAR